MRDPIHPPSKPSRQTLTGTRVRCTALRPLSVLAAGTVLFAAQLLLDVPLGAQSSPAPAQASAQTSSPAAPARATMHRHKKREAAKPAAPQAPAPAPAAPQIPNWPANDKPAAATVSWDSRGLYIEASNSSLDQILREICLKTGAKVEGMGADERIFGAYGPGPARDVLTELLDGSGYNILLIGDLGEGTPRRIVLSGRPTGPARASNSNNPGAANSNDAENDQESDQPDTNPPVQPPMPQPVIHTAPAVPMRAPQQMLVQPQLPQQPQNNPQN